jgi:two-component system chemotaxis response regulator CheY
MNGVNEMKSLVAEDDASSQTLLKKFLSRYGACEIAADGGKAVEMAGVAMRNCMAYDLICMDLRMPVMNGDEAMREIRKQEAAAGVAKPALIIVTTAHHDTDSIAGALLSRCNAYLVKPIDLAKLKAELKTHRLIS